MAAGGMTISQALIARIGATHAGLRRELNSATRTIRSGASSMRSAFRMASRAAAVVTAAVAGIGGAALKMASDFETGMAEVSTLLDVSLSGMGNLSSAVTDLSLRFGTKLTEQARALYQTISAGATEAGAATHILEIANKAAVAGITDVAVSVEAIMRVVNSYSLEASEAGRVSDLLFQIVRKGVTTFSELAPSIGQVAGTAATAGVSFEELAAIIATATKRLPIEQTITGVNQLFLSLISRTQDAEEAAAKLGVQWDASALATKGMSGVLGDLVDAMDISIEELQAIVGTGAETEAVMGKIATQTGLTTEVITALFPNVRALRVALAVLANGGQDLADQMENMRNAGGATDEAFQKMESTFGHLVRRVKQEVAVTFVELGQTLFPVGREIAGMIGSIARETRAWVSANRDLIQTRVEQVFTGIVRGAGKTLDVLVSVVDFFRRNPLAGEFGIVGLVFLGPSGAAVFTVLGAMFDQFISWVYGATDVAGKLQEKIDETMKKVETLNAELAFAQPTEKRVAEIRHEIEFLSRALEGQRRTLQNLGPEAKSAFEGVLESFRDLASEMQGFDFGDLMGGFGGGADTGGGTPTSRAAADVERMRFHMAEVPALVGEVSARLSVAAGHAAYLRYNAGAKLGEEIGKVGDTLTNRVGNVLGDIVTGALDLADAMKQLGKAILREVVSALARAAFYAAILKPLLGGIGLPGFEEGGVIKAQHGETLPSQAPPGFGGGIPVLAHPGEAILTRRTVEALGGAAAITAMNRGDHPSVRAGGGAGPVQVQMILPEADKIPEPVDYGMLATKPQVIRFMAEVLRQARFVGAL